MTARHPSQDPGNNAFQHFNPEMHKKDIAIIAADLNPMQRAQFWNTFQSTVALTCPSIATAKIVDDVAAVAAGSKPATTLTAEDLMDPAISDFMGQQHDQITLLSKSETTDYYGDMKYFLGKDENVRILAELYRGRGGEDSRLPADEDFHRAVGAALDYPMEAINAFVTQIAPVEQHTKSKRHVSRFLGALGLRH